MYEDTGASRGTGAAAPQLRLDERLEDLQAQIARVRSTRGQVHVLLEAVLAVGTDLDLGVVLRQIVESALTLVSSASRSTLWDGAPTLGTPA
ncbi:hypothetical protein [Streptomyces canus]|uniref:hypothetical protein n=1 Tax=Streptomyces TaxID=1883 RepID=UPI0036F0880F